MTDKASNTQLVVTWPLPYKRDLYNGGVSTYRMLAVL